MPETESLEEHAARLLGTPDKILALFRLTEAVAIGQRSLLVDAINRGMRRLTSPGDEEPIASEQLDYRGLLGHLERLRDLAEKKRATLADVLAADGKGALDLRKTLGEMLKNIECTDFAALMPLLRAFAREHQLQFVIWWLEGEAPCHVNLHSHVQKVTAGGKKYAVEIVAGFLRLFEETACDEAGDEWVMSRDTVTLPAIAEIVRGKDLGSEGSFIAALRTAFGEKGLTFVDLSGEKGDGRRKIVLDSWDAEVKVPGLDEKYVLTFADSTTVMLLPYCPSPVPGGDGVES
ncbi:MAG: hypothetical protein V1908_03965 [Candidatus Peregrinibacteria bacterium]